MAREPGHGMTFEVAGPTPALQATGAAAPRLPIVKPPASLPVAATPEPPKKPSGGGKPTLRRIK